MDGGVGQVIDEFREGTAGGVRWVKPEGIHLTLKFLGSTDAKLTDTILRTLQREVAGLASPTLSLDGLGTFPNGRNPRVIWAGVSGEMDTLTRLHECAESVAGGLGWSRERRPFRPHLTLGRVRDHASTTQRRRVIETLASVKMPGVREWRADTIRLYRSDLTPEGAIYTNLGEVQI